MNRIRGYYTQLAGDQANLFLLSGHDDGRGVFANAAVPPEGRTQYFTFGSVVAVINSVVGGSAVAIALGAFLDASLGLAAGAGGAVAIVSVALLLGSADRLLDARTGGVERCSPRGQPAARRPSWLPRRKWPPCGGLLVREREPWPPCADDRCARRRRTGEGISVPMRSPGSFRKP
jgi:hypothetical protein